MALSPISLRNGKNNSVQNKTIDEHMVQFSGDDRSVKFDQSFNSTSIMFKGGVIDTNLSFEDNLLVS